MTDTAAAYGDFSSWQEGADLRVYRQSFSRVVLRSGDGTYTDPTFNGRWDSAGTLNFRNRGTYHFARPGSGAAQAAAHLARVPSFSPGDVHMLDCEYFTAIGNSNLSLPAGQTVPGIGHFSGRAGDPSIGVWGNHEIDDPSSHDRHALMAEGTAIGLPPDANAKPFVEAWFTAVRQRYAAAGLLIYANAWWLNAAGITEADLVRWDVGWVVAAYGANYSLANGWSHACAWQYTDAALAPGISGVVDFNRVTCPSDWAHLFAAPIPPEAKTVVEYAPLIPPTDNAHHRAIFIARSAMHEGGWPMPISDQNDAVFQAGLKILQAYNGKKATGETDPTTWLMIFGWGPFENVKPPPYQKAAHAMGQVVIGAVTDESAIRALLTED